jgi:Bacteriocin-protection, YdeI or OmpD-Associated/Domain of unknown function (DUF1905)
MVNKIEFEARLEAGGEGGAWTLLTVPFSVEEAFGSRGRVSVKGTLNGFAYQTSLFPNGDGTHHMLVNRAMQKGANAGPGDAVRVEMERDDAPREIAVPLDFQQALDQHAEAKAVFERLPPSHRREYIRWIEEAKRPETRATRVSKSLEKLFAA